ncbi:Crp/Fnr family transcriptional regulator [Parachryseolinea silvisoli]|jgi:CRP-like cAMP-binding protein|uniref:Crp/Fnr family transcriptional regulator n=1 Tax=Parachryseolinea silvisoli TaxID=2873601 RepID=UPI002265AA3D|nr:Crp/Fnr family transcriptional regulator [Parachryseolinea silvisoli]MCD9018514.1 Crp/Fnr family transcriptional regulator [Parachryseolinea silvisoli]
MTTATILSAIQRHVTLTDDETAFFTSLLLPQRVRQGEMIEREGEPTRCFIFVNAGCLMTYFTDKEDVDHVIQFATTGWWTGDLHSFTKQVPSIYTTKGLADSEVWLLPKASMEQLLERVPRFERYFRIIFQNSLITQQHRIIQSYSATVDERYLQFREKYPSLEQYVPQKYIASYLGITPEFLSKVRRRLMEKS